MSELVQYWLLSALTLVVCGLAMWKGGPAERWGGAVILSLVLIERLCRVVLPPEYHPLLGLAGDALTALGLLALTVRFAGLWLGGAMLFYAANFVLHSVYFVTGSSPDDAVHYWVNNTNFAGIHICLVAGTLVGWRRRARARPTLA